MAILENEAAWSTTAATNASVDTGINWAENQDAATVNNSARGMMAARRKAALDQGGWILATGTANALIVATNQGYTAPLLLAGARLLVRAASVNTGAVVTIAVDGLSPANIKRGDGSALAIGDIQIGTPLDLIYNTGSSEWRAVNMASSASVIPIGSVNAFAGSAAPTGWLLCSGTGVSRTTYAALFSVISTTYGVGDGSTTFNLPDLRGRFVAGHDGGSGRLAVGYSGGMPANSVGSVGGESAHTLTTAELASHAHTYSGTSAIESASHVHGYSGITEYQSTTGFVNYQHSHTAAGGTQSIRVTGGGGSSVQTSAGTSNGFVAQTDTTSTDHYHSYSGSTGGESANHTHTYSGTTVAAGSGAAHNALPPTIVLNYIIFAGV